jgi:hypothetical protein
MHDPDAIIERVLSAYLRHEPIRPRSGRRAVLVLDDRVRFLERALNEANFHVVTLPKGLDRESRPFYTSGRILVTNDTSAFVHDAPFDEFGIIGLDALASLDQPDEYESNGTAKMISNAVTKHALVSQRERGPFVIVLHPEGRDSLVRLE